MPTTRRAQIADYVEACRLTDQADILHAEGAPWMFKVPGAGAPRRSEAYFEELLARGDSALFVADATALVGIAFARLQTPPELPIFHRQRWGVLDGLVVDPAWRRRGVGRSLTRAVETWALESGASWVELNVYEFNSEARRFYEALGYLPCSTKLRKPGLDIAGR